MDEKVIENPTYLEHVRHFFNKKDLEHMSSVGIDLSTYENLRSRSTDVYLQTLPPNANMPPSAERKWSRERSDSFRNWIAKGHLFGTPKRRSPKAGTAKRIRRDARNLDDEDIKLLERAFDGLIKREPDDPSGYFMLAGIHWFPKPSNCKHHESRYNPWHRAYLERFENALRSVEGCEAVTLPYWDITSPPPDFLYSGSFASYTLPVDAHPKYKAGYTTERFDSDVVSKNVKAAGIPDMIEHAMRQPLWEPFATFQSNGIEAAHDQGHGVVGTTLANADVAAFDPIFWFFHANWDRLWWEWQQSVSATTLWTFRSVVSGSTAFLEAPINSLTPFEQTADQTIDLDATGVGYELPASMLIASAETLDRVGAGSLKVSRGIRVKRQRLVSVRLKGIDRLRIPGSFEAVLKANDKVIARRTFFQSTEPMECENCRKNSHINLDFLVKIKSITGKKLSVELLLLTPDPDIGPRIPLHAVGNPSLNARILLEER